MAKQDMTVPFVLGLVGGILTLVTSAAVLLGGAMLSAVLPFAGFGIGALATILGAWGVIVSIIIIISSILIRGDNAKVGALLMLIFGILAFFTPIAGLLIGPILAIIGGALGYAKTK